MQKSEIGPGAKLENVILDKGVTITADKELKGDTNYPVILEKNSIV